MDAGSLTANGAVQSPSPSCKLPYLVPQSASSSMGDQPPIAADTADKSSANMVVSREERKENFYNYNDSTVLSNKGIKSVENSKRDSKLEVTSLEMETVPSVKESNSVAEGMGSDCEDVPVECADCEEEFQTLQQYMDHSCAHVSNKDSSFADNNSEMSDGESFVGKIVYNPDGSAYIIEGSDSEISDLELEVPTQDGAIIDKPGMSPSVPALQPISNAFFVPRNPSSFLNNFCKTSNSSQKLTHEAPIMHSYRVYDVRSVKDSKSGDESSDSFYSSENHLPSSTSLGKSEALTVPTKPILMCFICKLSFGFVKSFTAHAGTEHSMQLNSEERTIMSQKNASAIIQGVGQNKRPLMSFLEPMPTPLTSSSCSLGSKSPPLVCSNAHSSNSKHESTTVSYVYTKPKISLPSALENSSASDSVSSKRVNSWESSSPVEDMDEDKENSDSNSKDAEMDENSTCADDSFVNRMTPRRVKSEPESEDLSLDKSVLSGDSNALTPAATSANHLSPITSVPSPSFMNAQTFSGFLGMCDEHPQGRAQGVECPKCDMILSSSQSLGGHMTMMHSRNSCKTLKCPKCNWHYKYQETLEIHMKEKHPDNDTQCIYCITNQAHPRLARGETYSCGYKPYRCEVCNYSTTTKGNLSIHMQSDKHINNMQDLANGGTEIKIQPQQSPYTNNNEESQFKKAKPKQTWRCDVCNYETTVARNLRIHMTSEKHTHNMMVLQQNMKSMQRDMHMQMNQLMMLGQQDAAMYGIPSPMAGGMFPFDQQVLMAGLAPGFEVPVNLSKENGMSGAPSSGMDSSVDSSKLFQCCVCNVLTTDSLEALHQHLQHDRSKQHENEHIAINNGTYLCNLCTYKTNLKANFQLHCKTDKHIQRLQLVNHIKEGGAHNEWRLKYLNVSNPIQVRCNCCDYYTNSIHKLQIHTSNLQHESSAHLFRHLQNEESKLGPGAKKYYKCTVCDVAMQTKLRLIQHVHSMKHLQAESQAKIQAQETGKPADDLGSLFVVLEMNEKDTIQFEDEDGERDTTERASTEESTEVHDKPHVDGTAAAASVAATATTATTRAASPALNNASDAPHVCPYCTYSSSSEATLQAHVVAQHKHKEVLCPLCQDEFKVKAKLERHLMQAHNVTAEGLQRLLLLVDDQDWTAPQTSQSASKEPSTPSLETDEAREINIDALEIEHTKLIAEAIDVSSLMDKGDVDNQYRCQTCSKTFAIIDQLYAHQNELGHLELKQTPRGPGYLCWKKGCNQYFKTAQALQVHFREIHAKRGGLSSSDFAQFSHQCPHCTLAFKSAEKLHIHSCFHLLWTATSCSNCSKSFHSIAENKKHLETDHSDLGKAEVDRLLEALNMSAKSWFEVQDVLELKLKQTSSLVGSSLASISKLANSSPSLSCSPTSDDQNAMQDDGMLDDENDLETSCSDSAPDFESSAMLKDSARFGDDKSDSEKGESSNVYKEQQFMEDFINSQSMAEGSYEDPARKYKCHRCKVAFTKQNYLTAHNKTLQHRRGDKMSYPIERYLDPNRPFKCDVCKESFTQKNILLVHYNSVSHLHKLKQAAQTGTLPPNVSASSPTSSTTTSTTSSSSPSSESEKKPYRCNICNVAYSQGSTLDIHIRSVAHQTRASKIHELAMTGQIDINKPLIEQPDIGKTPQQLFSDLLQHQNQVSVANSLQQQSLLFPGLPSGLSGISQLPVLPGMPLPSSVLMSPTTSSPHVTTSSTSSSSSHKVNGEMLEKVVEKLQRSSEEKKSEEKIEVKKEPTDQTEETQKKCDAGVKVKEEAKEVPAKPAKSVEQLDSSSQCVNQPSYCCQRCSSTFTSPDALNTHQQIYCFLGAGANSLASQPFSRSRFMGRFKPQVHKNLLENIGFECVMQFNEYNQDNPVKREKDSDDKEEQDEDDSEEKKRIDEENELKKLEIEEGKKNRPDLPEINKSSCTQCRKDFSSVWVLKSHQEEVHKEMVPIKAIEVFGEQFKTDFDKKQPKEEVVPSLTLNASTSSSSASNEKGNNQEMPPPPPPPPPPPAVSLANQFDMSVMPSMFGMMPMPLPVNLMTLGMHPPLMPMMMPPGMDLSGFAPPVSVVDPNFLSSQQQIQQAQNQKRVRTRISDDQLKILRGYFDINNSPSEEQIQQMSEQSGLPAKVIKHWFRNTLFKERQRNKDSPYNFNNPPSTSIDLEEYEKTGKIPEIKTEPKDDYDDDDDLRGDDQESDLDQDKLDKFENIYAKMEPQKSEYHDDKREFESYSNASTPSTTSSIPSTPTPSVPNTPTPCTTPKSDEYSLMRDGGGSSGKRANRTRFTDFQIKVLQEYFEQNAYPKDDELDHLSKVLNLSPRVIVVWFQNARQKARKIYENQPAADTKEGNNTPFQRTPGLNYQCKKCNAVFQRYYELIKHQKRPCLTENNNNDSLSNIDDDSNSTIMSNDDLNQSGSIEAKESPQAHQSLQLSPAEQPQQNKDRTSHSPASFKCEKCDARFNRLDHWQEHQKVHTLNPSLFPNFSQNSAFGMLQNLAHQEDKAAAAAAAIAKRKIASVDTDEERDEQPRDKRLRTTILPEQLDYLYQKYQLDCNPSRKQLEAIAAEVGLKKRVVQVWFQNTRARERKGQYRAHQQLIHKRCPFCRALFRAKSALESHLATKHSEEMAKNEINVDAIPDASMESNPTSPQPPAGLPSPASDLNKLLSLPGAGGMLPFMPPSGAGMGFLPTDPLALSMNKIYEDSFKKYISELSGASHQTKSRHSSETSSSRRSETESRVPPAAVASTSTGDDDAPLDLSKPIKVNTETDKGSDGPLTDVSERSDDHILSRRISMDDSISETYSDFDNSINEENCSNVNSPPSPSNYHLGQPNKRYRTQMTSLQVRVMKALFQDYKTPTMAECELLGREIGLPKRVVQVWFQNARAKEKKSKLAYAKTYGNEVDFNKPPEECTLCSFKYSHKFTIQDHIFTKKHIDNAKTFIQSQADAEREMSDPTGMSSLLRQQRDMDRVRKAWDDASSSTPHLAQLQAMGMNAMGLPSSSGGGSSSHGHSSRSSSESSRRKSTSHGESSETEKKEHKSSSSSGASKSTSKQQQEAAVSAEMAMNAQMMSALGGFLPGMDPSFLPYMYPGLPGYFPGMGMPLLQPGLIPGAEHMMAYDPLSFGTPLPLLQIPQEAIKKVSDMLTDPKSSLASYTQDSKSMSDLKNLVSGADFGCAMESSVDVGYICKKCQMVYPAKEACVSHQRAMCFAGASVSEHMKPLLKLEQKQYECRACTERFSTVFEFKLHCQGEVHKVKTSKLYQRKSEAGSSSVSGGSSSGKFSSEKRPESASEDSLPKSKKPKIE